LLISFAQWRNYAIIWIVANGYWRGNAHLGSPFVSKFGNGWSAQQRFRLSFGWPTTQARSDKSSPTSAANRRFADKSLSDFDAGKTKVKARTCMSRD